MQPMEQSQSAPVPATVAQRVVDPGLWAIVMAAILVAAYAAWWQSPPPNALTPTFADRCLRPIEVNPAARLPLIPAIDVHALWFFSPTEGFVGGERGVLLHTQDAGRHWRKIALQDESGQAVKDGIYTIVFSPSDLTRGYLAGRNGLWLSTANRGGDWGVFQVYSTSAKLSPSPAAQSAVQAPRNARITLDTDSPAQTPQGKAMNQAQGAAGAQSPPLTTLSPPSADRTVPHIYQLAFTSDGKTLLAASSRGLLRHAIGGSFDGADYLSNDETWNVAIVANHVWVTGPHGYRYDQEALVRSGKMTGSWSNTMSYDHVAALGPMVFFAGKELMVGSRIDPFVADFFADIDQLDATHRKAPRFVNAHIRACTLAGDGVGWAVGEDGCVLRATEQSHDDRSIGGFTGALYAVWAFNGQEAVVAGEDGAMFRTDDAGATWQPMTANCWPAPVRAKRHYWRLPALWFYPVFGLLIWGGYYRWRTRPARQIEQNAIASELSTDRAVTKPAEDRLGFARHVRGLSRYLRNTATQPPVTLAITGAWGSGKTSFMNLLRSDLEERGLSTVWFNAWHHQQEPQILAPLLQTIRSEGAPSLFSAQVDVALRFRLRLLWRRLCEQRVLLFAMLILLCLALGVRQRMHATSPLTALAEGVAMLGDEKSIEHGLANLVGGGSFVGLIVGLGLLAWRVAVLFGVNPASLLATESGKTSTLALSEQTKFRQEFAARFREVTDALKPYPLVVFIDDLDRCNAAKIFQILEAINYVVSSGDCFVVLGMDEARVRDSVAQFFVATPPDEQDEKTGAVTAGAAVVAEQKPSDDNWTRARALAQNYLEKLVQLRVDVPTPSIDAIRRMAVPSRSDITDAESPKKSRWALWRVAAFWTGATLGASGLAFLSGRAIAPLLTRETADKTANSPVAASSRSTIVSNPMSTAGVGESGAATQPLFREREVAIGEPAGGSANVTGVVAAGICALVAGLLGVLAQRELRRREVAVVRDSGEFEYETTRWSEVLRSQLGEQFTPRALKRFKNRVRYFAMSLRDDASSSGPVLRDRAIVTLGALEQLGIRSLTPSPEQMRALPPEIQSAIWEATAAVQPARAKELFETVAAAADVRA